MWSWTGSGKERKSLRLDPTYMTGFNNGSSDINNLNIVISLYDVKTPDARVHLKVLDYFKNVAPPNLQAASLMEIYVLTVPNCVPPSRGTAWVIRRDRFGAKGSVNEEGRFDLQGPSSAGLAAGCRTSGKLTQ